MTFLNPTLDIAFKKLFGSQERVELTISFLNSVLERQEGELITHVHINDNANQPITRDKERTFVDVNCTDQKGNKYIIEMQVEDEKKFMERSQFYASFFLARQLEKKAPYGSLVPVIFVGVLCFDLFKGPDYLSHHFIVNNKTGTRTLKHLEWHFIELEKFTKTLNELVSPLEKWIFFLKHAEEMKQIPAILKNPQEMVTAFNVLEQHNWTEIELQNYYAQLNEWRCMVDKEQGIRKERDEAIQKIAKNLLALNMDIEKIAMVTELSIDKIKTLKS
jgi:predicted transposase/invertase (TIGR01784 family)